MAQRELAREMKEPEVREAMPTKEDAGIRDVAADLFLEARQWSPEELQSERDLVRKKLDCIIMPMLVTVPRFAMWPLADFLLLESV